MRVRLQSEPLATAFVPPVVAFGSQWDTVEKLDTSLSDDLLQSKALAVAADSVLNRLSTQVAGAIHGGKQVDVSLPLHQLYFRSSTPYDAARPILGPQLALMHPWPKLLSEATQPGLLALAPAVAAGIQAADDAVEKLNAAQTADDRFRLDGELRQIFAAYNALAVTTFGGLKRIVHDRPDLKLGADWAESFFLHESRSHGPTTVKKATDEVKRLEGELAEAQQRVADLVKKQKDADDARATAAQAKAAVVTAKQGTAAAKQKEKDAIAAAKAAKKAKKARA